MERGHGDVERGTVMLRGGTVMWRGGTVMWRGTEDTVGLRYKSRVGL